MQRDITALLTGLVADSNRAGTGLLVYAAAVLAASLLLITSWAPGSIVVAAAIVSLAYAGAGLAVIRNSVWRRAIVVTSCGLHVVVAVAWSVVLLSA